MISWGEAVCLFVSVEINVLAVDLSVSQDEMLLAKKIKELKVKVLVTFAT